MNSNIHQQQLEKSSMLILAIFQYVEKPAVILLVSQFFIIVLKEFIPDRIVKQTKKRWGNIKEQVIPVDA